MAQAPQAQQSMNLNAFPITTPPPWSLVELNKKRVCALKSMAAAYRIVEGHRWRKKDYVKALNEWGAAHAAAHAIEAGAEEPGAEEAGAQAVDNQNPSVYNPGLAMAEAPNVNNILSLSGEDEEDSIAVDEEVLQNQIMDANEEAPLQRESLSQSESLDTSDIMHIIEEEPIDTFCAAMNIPDDIKAKLLNNGFGGFTEVEYLDYLPAISRDEMMMHMKLTFPEAVQLSAIVKKAAAAAVAKSEAKCDDDGVLGSGDGVLGADNNEETKHWTYVAYRGKNRPSYTKKSSVSDKTMCRDFVMSKIIILRSESIKAIRKKIDNNTKSGAIGRVRYYFDKTVDPISADAWPHSPVYLVYHAINALKKSNVVTVSDEQFVRCGFGGFPSYKGSLQWKTYSGAWDTGDVSSRAELYKMIKEYKKTNWKHLENDNLNMELLGLFGDVEPDFTQTLAQKMALVASQNQN